MMKTFGKKRIMEFLESGYTMIHDNFSMKTWIRDDKGNLVSAVKFNHYLELTASKLLKKHHPAYAAYSGFEYYTLA